MIIALDFDGTCVTHEYPYIGKDIGAIPVLKELIRNGHLLILNTMRSDYTLRDAEKWFSDNEIPLYGSNINPTQATWTKSPKIYAHLYIDDAALGCPLKLNEELSHRNYVDWVKVKELLVNDGIIK